ncbi:regulator of sigma E protease [Natronocella acetinitrilica]|uniref:Regulator of sigma E protease n=1 Tax=Natronocella acetinitrilica TaxID=414046 RepID=A0AAE3G2Y4_9GAMM|nr:M50 family metallopeptidase [Natronocella acetinitrilica]MCP1674198.1 regulator of sigma E protease [Natronocella acetinitrilica]
MGEALVSVVVGVTVFVVALNLLVVLHELGHFAAARAFGVRVLAFRVCFGRALIGFRDRHGTHFGLGWLPLGGFIQMARDPERLSEQEAARQGSDIPLAETFDGIAAWKRIVIALAGPAANGLIAVALFFAVEVQDVVFVPAIIGEVEVGGPGAAAGLSPGQQVTHVNGHPVVHWGHVAERVVRDIRGGSVELALVDGGGARTTARLGGESYGVARDSRWIFADGGFRPAAVDTIPLERLVIREPGAIEALSAAITRTRDASALVFSVLVSLVSADIPTSAVASPVGVAEISLEVLTMGWMPYVAFIAIFSVNLMVFNLLPIPGLDGGHVVIAAAESAARRRLRPRTESLVIGSGFVLLIGVAVLAIAQDIWFLI